MSKCMGVPNKAARKCSGEQSKLSFGKGKLSQLGINFMFECSKLYIYNE